jgi:hypothetical protein
MNLLLAVVMSSTGAVCGHVDAPPPVVAHLQLENQLVPENIIVARSASEVVQTTVHTDGSFCFDHLNTDIHTITAFGDEPAPYNAKVTPIAGQTRYVEVEKHGGV